MSTLTSFLNVLLMAFIVLLMGVMAFGGLVDLFSGGTMCFPAFMCGEVR